MKTIIEITKRKCSDKVQPHIKEGNIYTVITKGKTNSGADVIVVSSGKKEYRINSERFSWKEISTNEALMKIKSKSDSGKLQTMKSELTEQERMKLAFGPFVINQLIWRQVENVSDLAGKYKKPMLKELSKNIHKLRIMYDNEARSLLPLKDYVSICSNSKAFYNENINDFQILYYSVERQFMRLHPDYPYSDMRSHALSAMALIQCADDYNRSLDLILRAKTNEKMPFIRSAKMQQLYFLLEGIAGDTGDFDFGETNVVLSKKVLMNKINGIEFNLV